MSRLCWARSLGDCAGGVSGEHPVSAGLFSEPAIVISGWGRRDVTVGLGSFKVNCLCRHHNSALSEVDSHAIKFSKAIHQAFHFVTGSTIRSEPLVARFDGPLLERWFVKTLITLSIRDCRGWTWSGGRALSDPPEHLVRCAFGLERLRAPAGLYDINLPGRGRGLENSYGVMTVADAQGEILGARFDFHMLLYAIWLTESEPVPAPSGGCPMFENLHEGATIKHHSPAGLFTRVDGTARCEIRVDW